MVLEVKVLMIQILFGKDVQLVYWDSIKKFNATNPKVIKDSLTY